MTQLFKCLNKLRSVSKLLINYRLFMIYQDYLEINTFSEINSK